MDIYGRVHSLESFGTVDGPGTRLVVFCQGCPMRCAYCHNPDTWDFQGGELMGVSEIIERFERRRPYYAKGGITVTGGEPLAQPEFVGALFAAAHAARSGRIHTCLDTSGISYDPQAPDAVGRVLDETDMVLLDVKHSDPDGHKMLCLVPADRPRALGDELARRNIPTIIRHVVVPGITDQFEELRDLGRILGDWDNVVGLDLLPYHTMGKEKYEQLGIPYRLPDTPPMERTRIPELRRQVLVARAERRRERGLG